MHYLSEIVCTDNKKYEQIGETCEMDFRDINYCTFRDTESDYYDILVVLHGYLVDDSVEAYAEWVNEVRAEFRNQFKDVHTVFVTHEDDIGGVIDYETLGFYPFGWFAFTCDKNTVKIYDRIELIDTYNSFEDSSKVRVQTLDDSENFSFMYNGKIIPIHKLISSGVDCFVFKNEYMYIMATENDEDFSIQYKITGDVNEFKLFVTKSNMLKNRAK
jgi:uncharacterized protein (UPF0248 family)